MNWKRFIGLLLLIGMLAGESPSWAIQSQAPVAGSRQYLPIVYSYYPLPSAPFILTTISLPRDSHPHGIVLDLDGRRAFVANNFGHSLSVLDTEAMRLEKSVALSGMGAQAVAYHPGTGQVYVSNEWSDTVSVVDPVAGVVVDTIGVGERPFGVGLQGDLVYVTNFNAGTVSVINALANTIRDTIPVGDRPGHIAVNNDVGHIYVAGHGSDRVITLGGGQYITHWDGFPLVYGVGFDPITARLYAGSQAFYRTVNVRSIHSDQFNETIDPVDEPFVIGVNSRTGHVFVVCATMVKVYDRRDNGLIATIPIGGGATDGIALDPSRNLVFVTSSDTDTVTVIRDVPAYDLVYAIWKQTGMMLLTDHQGEHGRTLAGPEFWVGYPRFRPDGRHITFSSYDGQEMDIEVMETGGANRNNLTTDILETADTEPVWSPDGSQIAWRRDWEIWLMDANGSNKRRLTPQGMGARTPRWSPDGRWIAFIAWHHDTVAGPIPDWKSLDSQTAVDPVDVLIVPAAGGTPINLTNSELSVDVEASWSPDSTRIAYMSQRGENFQESSDIYVADISDLGNINLIQLTTDPAWDASPTWSPDGSRIAFASNRDSDSVRYDFYLMGSDGSQVSRLTDGTIAFYGGAQWSPDGRYLAAIGNAGQPANQIFTIEIPTQTIRQITHDGFGKGGFDWRPDSW